MRKHISDGWKPPSLGQLQLPEQSKTNTCRTTCGNTKGITTKKTDPSLKKVTVSRGSPQNNAVEVTEDAVAHRGSCTRTEGSQRSVLQEAKEPENGRKLIPGRKEQGS